MRACAGKSNWELFLEPITRLSDMAAMALK
jgi:hypothetical protein